MRVTLLKPQKFLIRNRYRYCHEAFMSAYNLKKFLRDTQSVNQLLIGLYSEVSTSFSPNIYFMCQFLWNSKKYISLLHFLKSCCRASFVRWWAYNFLVLDLVVDKKAYNSEGLRASIIFNDLEFSQMHAGLIIWLDYRENDMLSIVFSYIESV
jgi:hypothetical protein